MSGIAECAKLPFDDRETGYGDPDFVDVPLDRLPSPGYNDGRRRAVGERADTGDLRPGGPTPRLPRTVVDGAGRPVGEDVPVGPLQGTTVPV